MAPRGVGGMGCPRSSEPSIPGTRWLNRVTPDGYVFVQIMRPGARTLSGDAFSGSADEVMRAVGFGGYCGTYVIKDGVIAHNVEVSLFPDWPGSEKRRTFHWDGDRLILTTLPSIADGAPRVSRLSWERVVVRT
jgi:Lipocalin-like domain